jgi:hypothetical protein
MRSLESGPTVVQGLPLIDSGLGLAFVTGWT